MRKLLLALPALIALGGCPAGTPVPTAATITADIQKACGYQATATMIETLAAEVAAAINPVAGGAAVITAQVAQAVTAAVCNQYAVHVASAALHHGAPLEPAEITVSSVVINGKVVAVKPVTILPAK